jgi:hypothetical protein
MNSNFEKSTIQKSVLAKIQREDIRMRPRMFFVLKIIGLALLTVLILVISILLCSYVAFTLRLNGHDELLSFGSRGILIFFELFPWPLLALDALLIFLLRQLMRQFKFGYRSPWLPAIIIIAAISIAGGVVLDRATPLNDSLLHQADGGHLPPPFGMMYRDSRTPQQPGVGEFRGVVEQIQGNTLVLSSYTESTTTRITVHVPTQGPDAHETYKIGEGIIVGGQMQNGVVQAFGIHPIDADDFLPFPDHDDSPQGGSQHP